MPREVCTLIIRAVRGNSGRPVYLAHAINSPIRLLCPADAQKGTLQRLSLLEAKVQARWPGHTKAAPARAF
jgi:hypothetical protein